MLEILNIKISEEITQDDINRQLLLINKLISDQFQSLTAPEIKEAMQMYVARKLTDKVFRLIDCVAIGEILTSYIEFRNISIQPFLTKRQNMLNLPNEKSDLEKENIIKSGINQMFLDFIESGDISPPFEHNYDFLVKHKMIKLYSENTPKLKEYYESKTITAKEQLLREELNNTPEAKSDREELKKRIESIKSGKSELIILKTKKLVLIDFFKSKIEQKIETIF